ncbi:hypothetical protein HY768_06215 [candidate division TA06 bacterium]|uniref:Guanylate cyclase domain-containing protein n=1 Tax=candidate division TA06 bacterium TaxID=2250710 RepID=A0A933IE64_UNCT6|nr:hypothetical protein [candidate division TA06 bacterium]
MKCPKCNFENPEGLKFCGECGANLAEARRAEELELRLKQVHSYIPQELAEKIARSKGQIEGERKQVSVLFADISGFTAMSEVLDPEEVSEVMNERFRALVGIVYKYEGTIDKFIGDCIMAIFGVPVVHENDAERAVRTALDMRKSLEQFNQSLERDKKKAIPDLSLHIGINSGAVIVGNIGSDLRMDYTVMGDTVNLASRLEGAAKSGQIFISKKTYQMTKGLFEFKELEPLTLKGKRQPVPAYEVLGYKERARPVRGIEGGSSPMSVGDFR